MCIRKEWRGRPKIYIAHSNLFNHAIREIRAAAAATACSKGPFITLLFLWPHWSFCIFLDYVVYKKLKHIWIRMPSQLSTVKVPDRYQAVANSYHYFNWNHTRANLDIVENKYPISASCSTAILFTLSHVQDIYFSMLGKLIFFSLAPRLIKYYYLISRNARAYQLGNTSSHTITEVKQHWAQLVLGWKTVPVLPLSLAANP